MTYQRSPSKVEGDLLGQEDLSPEHAVKQGAHDAIAYGIRYSVMAALALVVIMIVRGPGSVRKVVKNATGG
jgi:hypothetical protein